MRLLFLIATLLAISAPTYAYEEALIQVPSRRKFTHRDIRCGYDTSTGNWIRENWGPKCDLEFKKNQLVITIRESGKTIVVDKEQIHRVSPAFRVNLEGRFIHVKTEEGPKFLAFYVGHLSRYNDFWVYLDMWLHNDLGEQSLE